VIVDRRTFLSAGGALLLGACAVPTRGVFDATAVGAPEWRVGDTWTFRRVDGYNGLPRNILTRKVQSIGPEGIRFLTLDENGRLHDDALFRAPGLERIHAAAPDPCLSPVLRQAVGAAAASHRWQRLSHLHARTHPRRRLGAGAGRERGRLPRPGDSPFVHAGAEGSVHAAAAPERA
jgi:hypothetical protein